MCEGFPTHWTEHTIANLQEQRPHDDMKLQGNHDWYYLAKLYGSILDSDISV